jgi:hypothetical protein
VRPKVFLVELEIHRGVMGRAVCRDQTIRHRVVAKDDRPARQTSTQPEPRSLAAVKLKVLSSRNMFWDVP